MIAKGDFTSLTFILKRVLYETNKNVNIMANNERKVLFFVSDIESSELKGFLQKRKDKYLSEDIPSDVKFCVNVASTIQRLPHEIRDTTKNIRAKFLIFENVPAEKVTAIKKSITKMLNGSSPQFVEIGAQNPTVKDNIHMASHEVFIQSFVAA